MKLGKNTLLKKRPNKTVRMALAANEKAEKIRLSSDVRIFTLAEIDFFEKKHEFKPTNNTFKAAPRPFVPYKKYLKKKNKELIKSQKAKNIPLTYTEAANSKAGKKSARKKQKATLLKKKLEKHEISN